MNLESVQNKLEEIDSNLDKINSPELKEILDEIIFALDLLIRGINNQELSKNDSK